MKKAPTGDGKIRILFREMILLSYVYITEEGAHIQKKGGRFLVSRNLEIMFEIPEETLEGLVLIGSVQISSQAIISLLQLGIPVTWISHTGKFFGRLESTSHVNVFKQQKQIFLQDTDFSLQMSQKVVLAKVHNQLIVLQRQARKETSNTIERAMIQIKAIRKHIQDAQSREELMGYEGSIARVYFAALGQLVPEEFSFDKRTRQPPRDAFNTMLSFGYTLVMYDIYTAISNQGLHPYFGFLHALKNHHPALASDLMEEWRPVLIDTMVLSLINRHEILPSHFERGDDGIGVFLTRDGRAKFIKAYDKRLRALNKYGEERQSYRKALETQSAAYAQALMAEDTTIYHPIYIR